MSKSLTSIATVLLDGWSSIDSDIYSAREVLSTMCTTLAAVFGLIAALKIYNRWQLHNKFYDQPTADVALWVGGCLFFIIGKIVIAILFNQS